MSEHLHSFRKVAGKLYCTHPKCYRKMTQEDADGKLVKCNNCGSQFIFVPQNYSPTTLQITCSRCSLKGPWELTVETQKKLLGIVLMDELKESNAKQEKYLRDFETKLHNLKESLQDEAVDLERKRTDLKVLQEKTRRQRDNMARILKQRKLTLRQKKEAIPTKVKGELSPGDMGLAALEKIMKEGNII